MLFLLLLLLVLLLLLPCTVLHSIIFAQTIRATRFNKLLTLAWLICWRFGESLVGQNG